MLALWSISAICRNDGLALAANLEFSFKATPKDSREREIGHSKATGVKQHDLIVADGLAVSIGDDFRQGLSHTTLVFESPVRQRISAVGNDAPGPRQQTAGDDTQTVDHDHEGAVLQPVGVDEGRAGV